MPAERSFAARGGNSQRLSAAIPNRTIAEYLRSVQLHLQ
jgi:hypothetical protein